MMAETGRSTGPWRVGDAAVVKRWSGRQARHALVVDAENSRAPRRRRTAAERSAWPRLAATVVRQVGRSAVRSAAILPKSCGAASCVERSRGDRRAVGALAQGASRELIEGAAGRDIRSKALGAHTRS